MYTLVTHEGGQIMYVAIPYFGFMEAMVSWLINGENILFGTHVGYSILPSCGQT